MYTYMIIKTPASMYKDFLYYYKEDTEDVYYEVWAGEPELEPYLEDFFKRRRN